MKKLLLRPETFIYLALLVFTGAFFLLNALVQNGDQETLRYYFELNGSRIMWGALLFFVALFLYVVVLWIKALVKQVDPLTIFTSKNIRSFFLKTLVLLRNLSFAGLPFLLSFSVLTMALGPLNSFNATRLRDELLFSWDVFLTSTFPPLSLASFQYPSWFVLAAEKSFFYLVPVFIMFGAYLFFARQRLFREAASAFSLAGIIMFAGWTLFPVLSPHDRFIDNVYNLPISAEVQAYVDAYHPQEEIKMFLEEMRDGKKNSSVLPTSTFPSAHVAWAGLFVYYAWRAHRWLLVGVVPFAVLSSLGTFFFAQHYFVDFPAGIGVAAVSIFVAFFTAKKSGYV